MPTTAQMLTRENFASLLTPIHKKYSLILTTKYQQLTKDI